LLILATTSNKQVLEDMEFADTFNAFLDVPQISTKEEFRTAISELQIFNPEDLNAAAEAFRGLVSIKKLIMLAEMARQVSRILV
jgi:vesicle-fusing ATPase